VTGSNNVSEGEYSQAKKKKGGHQGRERVRGGYAGHFGGAKAKKARDLRSGGEGILAHCLTDRM
jgi:hypothetical protein